MATRRTEPPGIAQVGVDVEVDGAGVVAGLLRATARARLTEHPAAVDDPEPRLASAGAVDEVDGGDQR
jgi:hypothetical protein